MTGGLINIASYNSSDLYLTGSPQITFYKMVYRRYTNFAMECVEVPMMNRLEFGKESELVPPRTGDLIHKMYLHIVLPQLDITREDVGMDMGGIDMDMEDSSESQFNDMKNLYMRHQMNLYRIIVSAVNVYNITYYQMIQYIQDYVGANDMINIMEQYTTLLNNTVDLIKNDVGKYARYKKYRWTMDPSMSNLLYRIGKVDYQKLVDMAISRIRSMGYTDTMDQFIIEQNKAMKNIFMTMIEDGIFYCRKVMEFFFIQYRDVKDDQKIYAEKNIKFSWIRNIGHSIIEYIDLYIGGKKIDRHLGVWFDVWHQLTYRNDQTDMYNRMIGNVPELTESNYLTKPSYDLYIPMNFWFNQFSGLSFPLIAMQYNDLRLSIRLKKLSSLIYIEQLYRTVDDNNREMILTATLIDFLTNRARIKYTFRTIEIVDVANIAYLYQNKGIKLYGNMMIDYVYLDNNERRRFAQSGHEYLISTVQYRQYDQMNMDHINIDLDMLNLSKEIIWVFQKSIYISDGYGFIKNDYSNFSDGPAIDGLASDGMKIGGTATDGKNPLLNCQISFNNHIRSEKRDGKYYDRLQPYRFHHITPSVGINMFSFAIDPVQHQPSGNANFSRLNVLMNMTISPDLLRYHISDVQPRNKENVDFFITINNYDLADFLERIHFDQMKEEIDKMQINVDHMNAEKKNYLKKMVDIYTQLFQTIETHDRGNIQKDDTGTTYINDMVEPFKIKLSHMDLLIFKTSYRLTVFSVTTNVLRIIGGYGGIAFDIE